MSLKASLIVAAISTAVSGVAVADEFPSMEISGVVALSAGPAYWTADRKKAAKERVLFRDSEISAQVAGSSNLDFSRSRITPRSANTASSKAIEMPKPATSTEKIAVVLNESM